MHRTASLVSRLFVFPLLTLALVLAGCDGGGGDGPVGPGDGNEGHFYTTGVRVYQGGDHIVTVIDSDNIVDGTMVLTVGGTLGPLQVRFRTPDGDWESPEDFDFGAENINEVDFDVFTLDGDVAATTVTGNWSFTVTGTGEGQTGLGIAVLHGDHEDYSSALIPVMVNPSAEVTSLPVPPYQGPYALPAD